jgi:hypothetical protein
MSEDEYEARLKRHVEDDLDHRIGYFLTAQADDDPLPGVEVSPGMELVPVRLDAREVAEAFAVNLPPNLYPAPGYDLVGVLTGLVLEVMDDRKKDRGDPRS